MGSVKPIKKRQRQQTRSRHTGSEHMGTHVKLCEDCGLPLCDHRYCINPDCDRSYVSLCNCYERYKNDN